MATSRHLGLHQTGLHRRRDGTLPGYEITDIGPIDAWGEHYGGFRPEASLHGRRVLEKELPLEFFGVTVNSRPPGEGADYRHAHAALEELYFFVDGEGVMALDHEVVPVRAGSAVRVAQGVRRSWHANPDSPAPLRWLGVRAGGAPLAELHDATLYPEIPLPW